MKNAYTKSKDDVSMNASAIRQLFPGFSYSIFALISMVILLSVHGYSTSLSDQGPVQDTSGLFMQGAADLNGGAVMINVLPAFVTGQASRFSAFISILSESDTNYDLLYAVTNGDHSVFRLLSSQVSQL